jgi:hypothetical protein
LKEECLEGLIECLEGDTIHHLGFDWTSARAALAPLLSTSGGRPLEALQEETLVA